MKYYMETVLKYKCGAWYPSDYNGDKYNDADCLLNDIKSAVDIYILGVNDLLSDIEDIRGNIIDEPDIVFAYYDDNDNVRYGGIKCFDIVCENEEEFPVKEKK